MAPDDDRLTIRDATVDDGAACAAVYEPYVWETAITFETEPPGAREMAERIAAATEIHAWLVLEDDCRVCGFAYGGPFRTRAAYRWSCEVSVYLETGRRRTGAGRLPGDRLQIRRLARRILGPAAPVERGPAGGAGASQTVAPTRYPTP